jgi:hypothetical protein
MRFSNVFTGRIGIVVAALALAPLLAGCATQLSGPTIFGARIAPGAAGSAAGDVYVVAGNESGLTIFGVPTPRLSQARSGVALAATP